LEGAQGSGQLGINNPSFAFTLTNNGVVHANQSGGTRQVAPTNTLTNTGTLEASNNGVLSIANGTVINTSNGMAGSQWRRHHHTTCERGGDQWREPRGQRYDRGRWGGYRDAERRKAHPWLFGPGHSGHSHSQWKLEPGRWYLQ
jgi:hypothetical protein